MRGPIEPKKMTKHGFGNCSIEDKGNDKVDGQNGQQLKMLVTGKNWVKKKQKFSKPIISQQNSKKICQEKKTHTKKPTNNGVSHSKTKLQKWHKKLVFFAKKNAKSILEITPLDRGAGQGRALNLQWNGSSMMAFLLVGTHLWAACALTVMALPYWVALGLPEPSDRHTKK